MPAVRCQGCTPAKASRLGGPIVQFFLQLKLKTLSCVMTDQSAPGPKKNALQSATGPENQGLDVLRLLPVRTNL